MTINKIEESIQIAEELAKEICTGKESDSLSAQQWKKAHPNSIRKYDHRRNCYRK